MGIIKKKICLLGAFSVGKTSLVERFVHERFEEKYLTTVGINVSQKLMPPMKDPRGGETIQYMFLIWDIAVLDKFDLAAKNYFRGAAGAIAVADLTRPETVDVLKLICEKFFDINPNAALVAVGNKSDLYTGDKTVQSALTSWASQYSAEVALTSAKSGDGVVDVFKALSHRIRVSDE